VKMSEYFRRVKSNFSLTFYEYICVTVQFVDENGVLQKRVLNFSFIGIPHNGVSLCEKMYNMIKEWEIENKLFSITLDNA
jgi:hypothetical protein